MTNDEVREHAFAMPINSPAYPPGAYRFVDREYLIITYRTDPVLLDKVIPAPLKMIEPVVKVEFINMPDSTGFGPYCGAGQLIPVVFDGVMGNYIRTLYLNAHPPIAGGRELWGFPEKLGQSELRAHKDTLMGTLDISDFRVATGTMGFKHREIDSAEVLAKMSLPNFLLKIIPHVDGTPRICELVRYYLSDIRIKGAWSGPGAIDLHGHALAPMADLPILEVVSTEHIIADLTLPLGEVVHDYLAKTN